MKLIKNITNSSIDISDVGITIPANSNYTIQPQDFLLWAASSKIIEFIGSGVILVNDGIDDLDKAESVALIQGNTRKLSIENNLLTNDRIRVDVTGTLSDAKVQVSSNDGTSGYLEEKITSGSNKVNVTVQNEGANELVSVDINPANILTSELNNDAGFIDSSQAPVQTSDISDFETTAELNSRDTTNRDRINHTGTQTASTISDFSTAVQAEETDTTLSFNSVTNILSYVNEAGTTSNIDLTQFVDDTNLARITSGVMNAATNIVTFTRDDTTTFTVDFSSLNDQSYVNTQIASHEQSINNHDDVNTTGAVVEDFLRFDGTNWIPYDDFKDFISTTSGMINQSTSFKEFMSLSTDVPATSNYKISWTYEWSINTTGSDFEAQIVINNSTTISDHKQEAKDSAGSGITLDIITGGSTNSGTSQRYTQSGHHIIPLTAGVNTIDLDWACEQSNSKATIYRATISIERYS